MPTCRSRRPASAAAACSRPRTTASTSWNGASPTWWARPLRPPPPDMSEGRPLRVAAIGDVHATPSAPGRWRETFARISHEADILCLCGDLTNHGTVEEAQALAEDLRSCTVPVLAVLGNHDHHEGKAADVQRIACEAGVKFLEDEVHTHDGVGFAGVKGFCGGFDGRMLDAFGEQAVKAFVQETLNEVLRLEHALKSLDTDRTVVVLHYAPVAATVAGEP